MLGRFRIASEIIKRHNYARTLDLGCARGEFVPFLKERSKQVCGIDLDKEYIETARKNYPDCEFKLARTEEIPYTNNYFDLIVMLEVLEHTENEEKSMMEISRTLKKNGELVLSVPNKGITEIFDPANYKFYFPGLYLFLNKLTKSRGNAPEIYSYTKKTNKSELKTSDLTNPRLRHRHYGLSELTKLLGKYDISIEEIRYFGLFLPFISLVNALAKRFKLQISLLDYLEDKDSDINVGKYSYTILLRCKKN